MTEYNAAIVAVAFVAFAAVSARLGRSVVTGTMVFMALGFVIGPEVFDLVDLAGLIGQSEFINLVLTSTLVIVLFTDASAINASKWRDDMLAARLLGVGLPLAVVFGWIAAAAILGNLEFWEAAVLGAMLAPTDAALGKAVVSNPRVPTRIRQSLNIESGLNDGIILPLFVVFLETARAVESSLDFVGLVTTLIEQVGIAVVVGVVIGIGGARLLRWGRSRGVASGHWLQIGLVALAVSAYALAVPLGGSGFIAAWVAGLLFGRTNRVADDNDESLPVFAETAGDLLTMLSFLIFGIYLGPAIVAVTWQVVVYAVVSLVVVRMLAVVIAMVGRDMRPWSVVYMGWFGPRGLATIILTIEIIDNSGLEHAATIADAAIVTVALSVVAHGATAWWGSNAYADYVERHPNDLAESAPTTVDVRLPLRSRHGDQDVGSQAGRTTAH